MEKEECEKKFPLGSFFKVGKRPKNNAGVFITQEMLCCFESGVAYEVVGHDYTSHLGYLPRLLTPDGSWRFMSEWLSKPVVLTPIKKPPLQFTQIEYSALTASKELSIGSILGTISAIFIGAAAAKATVSKIKNHDKYKEDAVKSQKGNR